jgi:hypothetical protein
MNWIDKIIYVLPTIIIVESYLACIPLVITHRWGSALYWFSAGTINIAAVYLIKRYG